MPRIRISLANKCQILFGAAVLLILSAALFVPWLRMQKLVEESQREVARELGIRIWDKPAFACLGSRFPYGTRITEERLTRIARAVAEAHGGTARVCHSRNYPVMVNHDAETTHAAEAARRVAGDCAEAPLIMGGEDFAYMLNARPGAYILVGNGDSAPVHHPEYDFNDEAIPAGCSWFAELVERRMPAA